MGKGARVMIFNLSPYNVNISTKDHDWIGKTDHLSGMMPPGNIINNGYFEYADLHTGHITICGAAEDRSSGVQLGLVDRDIMNKRTVTQSQTLKLEYDKSVYHDQSTFVMIFLSK